jgi:glycosyltransferase involved in cell wall biosynthesis
MRILYLYTELLGYQVSVLKELSRSYKAEIHVVLWDKNKLKPYKPTPIENVTYHPRSSFSADTLISFSLELLPDIVYISGWQDHGYLPVANKLKKLGKPIVVGFDDQWKGTCRQHIGSLLLRYYMKKNFFTYAWVAGPYQYEYAKKMGFKNDEIIYNLLTCDSKLFSSSAHFIHYKKIHYPKTFLYVGNFRHAKGTDILANAYKIYKDNLCGDWTLVCIGNGPLESNICNIPGISVMPFATPESLVEISGQVGAFILPSRHEQWGVVVHEFALAGLPLILSDNVGSAPAFLIDGYNGYKYRYNSPQELAKKMLLLSNKDAKELVNMGYRSHMLAKKISPGTCAASFVSILES